MNAFFGAKDTRRGIPDRVDAGVLVDDLRLRLQTQIGLERDRQSRFDRRGEGAAPGRPGVTGIGRGMHLQTATQNDGVGVPAARPDVSPVGAHAVGLNAELADAVAALAHRVPAHVAIGARVTQEHAVAVLVTAVARARVQSWPACMPYVLPLNELPAMPLPSERWSPQVRAQPPGDRRTAPHCPGGRGRCRSAAPPAREPATAPRHRARRPAGRSAWIRRRT